MKRCSYCGMVQEDARAECQDCGGRLGRPMTDEEEALNERRRHAKEYPIGHYVFVRTWVDWFYFALVVTAYVAVVACGIVAEKYLYAVISFFYLGLCVMDVLCPRILWQAEVWRIVNRIDKVNGQIPADITPSYGYMIGRRIVCWVFVGLEVFCCLTSFSPNWI